MSEPAWAQAPAPAPAPGVIGGIVDIVGSGVKNAATTALDAFGAYLWEAGLQLLRAGMSVADNIGGIDLNIGSGPLAPVWPVTVAVGTGLAGLLFYVQLISTAARGGRGLLRALTGGVQFVIALTAAAAFFAALVALADGLTETILQRGLQASNFTAAFNRTGFSDAGANAVKGPALALMSMFGVVPVSLGFAFENVIRAATVYLLVGVIPITAAGLLFGSTRSWFWTTANWCMAAIMMKPVMALAVWLGVAIAGGGQGLNQLITGLAVLLVSLFAPLALFKLFSFASGEATDAFRSGFAQAKDFVSPGGGSGGGSSSPSGASKSMESASDTSFGTGADSGGGAGGGGGRTDSVYAGGSAQSEGGTPGSSSPPNSDGSNGGGGGSGGGGGPRPAPRPPTSPGGGGASGGGAAAGAEELAVVAAV